MTVGFMWMAILVEGAVYGAALKLQDTLWKFFYVFFHSALQNTCSIGLIFLPCQWIVLSG
jgi:hypothetical protein